ncbi:MAG: hypothetical protein M8354_02150, partial [Halalkalicoccus sp.]|nr:hypothetical protein [Halalkalicoccus sp.]
FDFRADQLWSAYLAYATLLGNEEQYLIGEDQPWYEAAEAAGWTVEERFERRVHRSLTRHIAVLA